MSDSLHCSRRSALAAPLVFLLPRTAGARAPEPLFVITRSTNKNVVHYECCFDERGQLDRSEPVRAYWVMHEDGGRREGLTWVERQLAYGWSIASKVSDKGFNLRLLAFPHRPVAVRATRSGQYRAVVTIAARTAILQRIFVRVQDGDLVPHVDYVELFGTDAKTREPLVERIEP
jgi:phosphatidylinositol phosphate synthase